MTGNIMRVPPAITPSLHENREASTGVKALAVLLVILLGGVGNNGGGPNDDTVEEFMIHGDPAFNPCEPNHNG